MADFVPHTKYDIGSQYYSVVADLMARCAYLGIRADSYDMRAIIERLSSLKQWLRCISPVACKKNTQTGEFEYDKDLINAERLLSRAAGKVKGNRLMDLTIISDMNEIEMGLLLIMKKYKMLTKFETGITNEDRLRDEMGVRGGKG